MNAVFMVSARYVLPVRPRARVLEHHSVVFRNQKIVTLLPTVEARKLFPDAIETNLPTHVLMPGLINMHTHSPMSLLRGYAEDMPMQDWLQHRIWPAESKHMGKKFVADGTRLAIAEMLRAGTTCFNENYFFPEVMLEVVEQAGIRVRMGLPVIDAETAWAGGSKECLEKASELLACQRYGECVTFSLAPHAPYTVSDQDLVKIAELSQDRDIPVHLHLLETSHDISHSMDLYGEHPLRRLDRTGLLTDRLQAVHMTQLQPPDIDLIAERGVHVIHCPQSNLKLASGFCPVVDLLNAGVNVSVGTDGVASNNNLDLLAELQTAALMAKGLSGDASNVDAFTALDMITINAAKALRLESVLGSVQPGKWADLAALDLNCPETQPLNNISAQLVYAASSRQFTHVWVAGELLLKEGNLTTIDLPELLENSEQWRVRLAT